LTINRPTAISLIGSQAKNIDETRGSRVIGGLIASSATLP
jgi:hypothetical protein